MGGLMIASGATALFCGYKGFITWRDKKYADATFWGTLLGWNLATFVLALSLMCI